MRSAVIVLHNMDVVLRLVLDSLPPSEIRIPVPKPSPGIAAGDWGADLAYDTLVARRETMLSNGVYVYVVQP